MASFPPTEAGTGVPRRASPSTDLADRHPTSVLLVDEQRMFTDALSGLLAAEGDLEPIGTAHTVSSAVAACRRQAPDVVLVDVQMSDGRGVDAIRRIRAASPAAVVIVVTAEASVEAILAAVRAGARGYVPKTRSAEELTSIVRRAVAGEMVLAPGDMPSVVERLHAEDDKARSARTGFDRLTAREVEILTWLASGRSTEQTAKALHISPLTVRSHVKNILAKLGVHSKVEAVAHAISYGLIDSTRTA